MALDEAIDLRCWRWFVDKIGYVDGIEIAGAEEAANGLQVNVVGVAIVRQLPIESLDGGIGGSARRGWFGADDGVLAIRLVPNRDDFDS